MTDVSSTVSNTKNSTNPPMHKHKTKIFTTGFALFAMFFGAGNIIFPLALGAESGQNLPYAILGFLIFGVGAPFLGLYATSIFEGDYEHFFNQLGKVPAFLVITFLMLVIGPLSAMPRTEVITYETIKPFIPENLNHPLIFSIIYCSIVFLSTYKETRLMNVLGYILSPIKLISFGLLIILGLSYTATPIHTTQSVWTTFSNSVVQGYGTMDLLAAFFFCSIAYRAIKKQAAANGINDKERILKMTLQACLIGGACLGIVYIGFMSIASLHSANLQHLSADKMIGAISYLLMGKYGAIFVCICITFACLATAIALAEVTSNYLHQQVFQQKISKVACLTGVTIVMLVMSQLGFAGIMAIATPILIAIYPALIALCIANIFYKRMGFKHVKPIVWITFIASLVLSNI